jgi:ABC-type amino acid transport substrate-binding protein
MDVHAVVVTDLTKHKQLEDEKEDLLRKLHQTTEKGPLEIKKGIEASGTPESVEAVRQRLEEAEQTLDAIRGGEVDALVINKIDLLPYVPFRMDFFQRGVEVLNPGVVTFPLSCWTGEGLEAWLDWVTLQVSAHLSAKSPA